MPRLRATRLTAIAAAARRVISAPAQFTVRDASSASYTSPLTVRDAAGATYTITATAQDGAGNTYTLS